MVLVCQTPNGYWNGFGMSNFQEKELFGCVNFQQTGMVLVCQTTGGYWNGFGVSKFQEME